MSVTFTFHLAQACLCGYTGTLSYSSIRRLQQYEESTEKAAQYSSLAAEELHRTRTTQASGAVATLASLTSSLYLCAALPSGGVKAAILICAANAFGLSRAYSHISDFWLNKAKVPYVKDYNDAIESSNIMRQYLIGLSLSWWVAAVYYLTQILLGAAATSRP